MFESQEKKAKISDDRVTKTEHKDTNPDDTAVEFFTLLVPLEPHMKLWNTLLGRIRLLPKTEMWTSCYMKTFDLTSKDEPEGFCGSRLVGMITFGCKQETTCVFEEMHQVLKDVTRGNVKISTGSFTQVYRHGNTGVVVLSSATEVRQYDFNLASIA